MTGDTVLSLYDESGNMVQDWASAGYICYCVDITHPAGESWQGNICYVGADILNWLPPLAKYAIVFAFTPCTNLAVSGARWFKSKGLSGLIEALQLVERARQICEWAGAPWLIENPISTLSTYWREPDYTFNPCDYGLFCPDDAYTKKTCLWTGGGFVMPEKAPVEPVDGSRMHKLPPSKDRATVRSATPRGFARAVFEANARMLAGDAAQEVEA